MGVEDLRIDQFTHGGSGGRSGQRTGHDVRWAVRTNRQDIASYQSEATGRRNGTASGADERSEGGADVFAEMTLAGSG